MCLNWRIIPKFSLLSLIGYYMSANEGQDEYDEVQEELKKKDTELEVKFIYVTFLYMSLFFICHFLYMPFSLHVTFLYMPFSLYAIFFICHFLYMPFSLYAIFFICHFLYMPFSLYAIFFICHFICVSPYVCFTFNV